MTSANIGACPRQRSIGSTPITPLLLMLVIAPPLIFYAGLSSSLALGTSLVAGVILAVAAFPRRTHRVRLIMTPAAFSALTVFVVTAHALVASIFQPVDAVRAITSLVPLVLVIAGGCALAGLLRQAQNVEVDHCVRICFAVLCFVSTLPMLGFSPESPGVDRTYAKPVFPFTEPSHFALIFIPLLMYCAVRATRRFRLPVLLLGAAVALLLQNLTLVAGCVLVACVCIRGLVLPVLFTMTALAATQFDLSYYADRLDFSGDVQNLSNLVYLQGWQQTFEAVEQSKGWGLGFQQLGLLGSDTPAAQVIFALIGDYANLLDGGLTFAKLVGEFGALGLLLLALYLRTTVVAIRSLRATARGGSSDAAADVLARAVLVSYLIELFVRGAGYFTSSGLLLVASVMLLAWRGQARRGEQRRPVASGLQPVSPAAAAMAP